MEPNGILIIQKHSGVTSHDIVNRVRRLYGTRRVGHTGTLDPMASGVLVVLVGRAAKAAEYLTCDKKSYRATLRLGLTTDTEDITGQVLSTCSALPSEAEVLQAAEAFRGSILQTPPMYSALKVDGRKLYDLAREGKTVERTPRPITIFSLSLQKCTETDYELDVTCSAGTYIRTLCADLGTALGCGGVMASLLRTEAGGFSLEDAHTVQELEKLEPEQRLSCLLPTEQLFQTLPAIRLPAFYEKLARNGCEIYQSKLKTTFPLGQRLRVLTASGDFFALGEIRDYETGDAIKLLKLFDLGE